MTHYSVQARDICKRLWNIFLLLKICIKVLLKIKTLMGKNSQKPIDHTTQYAIDAIKTASKRAIQKVAEANGDLNGKKIVDKIAKTSKKE